MEVVLSNETTLLLFKTHSMLAGTPGTYTSRQLYSTLCSLNIPVFTILAVTTTSGYENEVMEAGFY